MQRFMVVVRMLTIVALSGLGCRRATEDRGPLLAKGVGGTNIVWTADGAEVVYVASTSGAPALQAVRVADGALRQLDVAVARPDLPLARSANGSALYYFTDAGVLREALSGKDERATSPASWSVLATSADGHLVAYVAVPGIDGSPEAAALVDVDRATLSPLTHCGPTWFRFSPPGDAVLCADVGAPSNQPEMVRDFVVVDLTTGDARERLAALVGPQDAWFGATGPKLAGLLDADGTAMAVNDLRAGTARVVYRLLPSSSDVKTRGFPAMSGASFSADGAQLAFWAAECLGANFAEPEYCDTAQGSLVVVDLETGSHRVVASGEATGGGGIGPMAFSDDGARIAYRFARELHVRPTHP